MLYQTNEKSFHVTKKKSFDFVPHAHHVIELLICTEGPYELSCNFRTETLRTGDVMIAFSNDIHAYTQTEGGEGIMIMADPSLFRHAVLGEKGTRYENFLLTGDAKLVSLGNALLEEYRTDQSMTVMMGYLYVILGKLLKDLPCTRQASSVDAENFSKILKYVSENYTQKLSLKSLGKKFGISESHLSRSFTQKLACSFLRYLHSLRVEHAKNLLRHSSMSILEIVYDSGFSDQRTFNRVFREWVGMTPKEYRLEHGKK